MQIMSKNQKNITPKIINITGKPAGSEVSHKLQSVYPVDELMKSLGIYLARSLEDHVPIEIAYFQKVINKRADEVDELKALSFEPNQRIGELVALVSLVGAINKINKQHKIPHTDFVPAWQKAGQNDSIEEFTGKGSWDGFMYEYVPVGEEDSSMEVVMIGVEIKSLMINPGGTFTNLNDLLTERMPKFSKHFQIDGSLAVVLVPPYSNALDTNISFDLKQASEVINGNVGKVVSAIVFIDNKNDGEETTISTLTSLVHKDPKIVDDNIDLIEMVRVPFCKIKNNLK
jgi:hypothetical protein